MYYTLQDFDFTLPNDLIAKTPNYQRSTSRLLVYNNNAIEDDYFQNIISRFHKGDLIILNDSKVIKSRIILPSNIDLYIKEFISEKIDNNRNITDVVAICYAKPAKKLAIGDIFHFDDHIIQIINKLDDGTVKVTMELINKSIYEFLEEYGSMPLPPYMKRKVPDKKDDEYYQTVYAKYEGSIAAPTAGLHFSTEIIDALKAKGVEIKFITLHVGAGTFLPIKTNNILEHKMHSEKVSLNVELLELINKKKQEGKNVIAVGTTVIRALESVFMHNINHVYNKCVSNIYTFDTDIFIKPGFVFKSANILLTNFHLPKSTLVILISAFAGHNVVRLAYPHAIKHGYKFFSYGDATLLYIQTKSIV